MHRSILRLALLFALFLTAALRADDPKQLVFIFQKQKDPASLKQTADKVAKYLTSELGMPVQTVVPSDYSASIQALVSHKADIAYVDSMPFLLARRDGKAELLLAEVRTDPSGKSRTDYDSILVARKDSPIKSIEDIVKNAADLRLVFTSTTSTSGYLMAYRRFVTEKLLKPRQDPREVFASVNFGGSYTQALKQVVEGRADFCAVSDYTLEGPRADVYLPKEDREQLRIVARTPHVPTHLICARDGLSDGLKSKIKSALLKLCKDQPDLIADVYGASHFAEVDQDQHVAAVAEAVSYVGIDLKGAVHK